MTPINQLPTLIEQSIESAPKSPHTRLSPELIANLKPIGRVRNWRRGQTLLISGQSMTSMCICLSGQFSASLQSIDGHSQFLRYIADGEPFGVPSLFTDAPFPTDLVCVEDGATLEISKSAFEERLKMDPNIAIALIRILAFRVTELFNLMEADLLPSLRSRVFFALRRLAYNQGLKKHSNIVILQLSQSEIASAVNASRQKVHKELKTMEVEGLLLLGYKNITLQSQFFTKISK